MGGHLAEDTLMGLLEGEADAEARVHAEACAHCQARLEQAGLGLTLAHGADVPEPGPFYWQAFRQQVGSRIRAGERAPFWRRLAVSPWLAAAAVAVVALGIFLPWRPTPRPSAAPSSLSATAVLPAWSALPPAEEDAGLQVLAAVVPHAGELNSLECQGLGQCLGEAASLSEEDGARLEDALRRDLGTQL